MEQKIIIDPRRGIKIYILTQCVNCAFYKHTGLITDKLGEYLY